MTLRSIPRVFHWTSSNFPPIRSARVCTDFLRLDTLWISLCHPTLLPGPFPFRARTGIRHPPQSKRICSQYSIISRSSTTSTRAWKPWKPGSSRTRPPPSGPRRRTIRRKSLASGRRLSPPAKRVGNRGMLATAKCCCRRPPYATSSPHGVRVAIRRWHSPSLVLPPRSSSSRRLLWRSRTLSCIKGGVRSVAPGPPRRCRPSSAQAMDRVSVRCGEKLLGRTGPADAPSKTSVPQCWACPSAWEPSRKCWTGSRRPSSRMTLPLPRTRAVRASTTAMKRPGCSRTPCTGCG